MPTPNALTHDALPLCHALAADPARSAFAVSLNLFLTSGGEFQRIYHQNLNGILYAYRELGVIKHSQLDPMLDELEGFTRGASA